MSAVELGKNPIAQPQVGPFKIKPEDWQMLVRHTKAFSHNPTFATYAAETVFVIVSENKNARMLLLPVITKTDMQIPDYVRMLSKDIVAFGYVRGESENDNAIFEFSNEPRKTTNSLDPADADVKLSVEIDKIAGKPVYYIIINRKFEYEIYRTPTESLYGILQPAQEESEYSEKESFKYEEEFRYAYECETCSYRFVLLSDAKEHAATHQGHKIIHIER